MTDSATTTDGTVPQPLPSNRARQIAALSRPRYEILPLTEAADEVQEHVPGELPITVTASPRRGMEPTVALTEDLARRGFAVVPHLAARLVRDEAHLHDLLQRFQGAGVVDLFVVSGDGDEPVGDFRDSFGLLTAIQVQRSGSMPGLKRIGIASYPEGHPLVDEERLWRALFEKEPMSTYVVSQMCFDAGAVLAWAAKARRAGLSLPLHAGIPGVVDRLKLVRVASRIGVGESVRFVGKHQHGLFRLFGPRSYRPDRLVATLMSGAADSPAPVAGLHIYTLGDIAGTERWRRRTLDRLTRGPANG